MKQLPPFAMTGDQLLSHLSTDEAYLMRRPHTDLRDLRALFWDRLPVIQMHPFTPRQEREYVTLLANN